ncbi:MAG: 50S ribosomal protein L18 [Candidatus Saccharimonadales bacterium]
MTKLNTAIRKKRRIRARIFGTSERPRLCVKISNKHVSAQLVNDDVGKTLAYSTTVGRKETGPLTEKAAWVGADLAKKAKKAKIKQVVFDRGTRIYHGRVKALANAARKEGLEF